MLLQGVAQGQLFFVDDEEEYCVSSFSYNFSRYSDLFGFTEIEGLLRRDFSPACPQADEFYGHHLRGRRTTVVQRARLFMIYYGNVEKSSSFLEGMLYGCLQSGSVL